VATSTYVGHCCILDKNVNILFSVSRFVVDTYGRKENVTLLTQTNNHTFLHHAIQTLLCYDMTRNKQRPETPDYVFDV